VISGSSKCNDKHASSTKEDEPTKEKPPPNWFLLLFAGGSAHVWFFFLHQCSRRAVESFSESKLELASPLSRGDYRSMPGSLALLCSIARFGSACANLEPTALHLMTAVMAPWCLVGCVRPNSPWSIRLANDVTRFCCFVRSSA
jgi:hypothetical protein